MIVGTGISIAFSSGFLAEILEVRGPSAERIAIDVSHHATPNNAHVFKPGELVDWGELSIDIGFDPTTAAPMTGAIEEITITWPDSGASTWVFDGFMTAFEVTNPLEDKDTASVTIKISGPVTI